MAELSKARLWLHQSATQIHWKEQGLPSEGRPTKLIAEFAAKPAIFAKAVASFG